MLMERLEAIREMKEANENEFKYGGRGRKGPGGTQ
jgi:hypothetical protein